MQPFVNVYTRFAARRRQDRLAAHGPVGRPELEAIARQHLRRAGAGARSIRGPRRRFASIADKVIPPMQPPPDTELVKRIKIRARSCRSGGDTRSTSARRAAAEGLRQASRRPLSGELRAGPLLAARARRLRRGRRVRHVLARRRHAADDLRHAAAPVAVLRRLLRRELGEQRPVRRRHHAGADSGG